MPDFLLEIGVEEIPDWMIESALTDLKSGFEKEFGVLGGNALRMNATPRRLVLRAEHLAERAPDTQNVTLGPYLSAGAGAAQGFARKWNTSVDALAKTTDAKGERYVFHQHLAGESALQLLTAKLPQIITSIRFPKAMYWTDKGGVRFIRPIRWIVALLDDTVVRKCHSRSSRSGRKTACRSNNSGLRTTPAGKFRARERIRAAGTH